MVARIDPKLGVLLGPGGRAANDFAISLRLL